MWFRFIVIGLLSVGATSVLFYQGVEIFQAFMNYFDHK